MEPSTEWVQADAPPYSWILEAVVPACSFLMEAAARMEGWSQMGGMEQATVIRMIQSDRGYSQGVLQSYGD